MVSSAPCLWGTRAFHNTTERCWENVVQGTGYCKRHQPEPYGGKAGTGWKKPAGWGRLREQVMQIHKGVCYVCGQPGADEVDHITPLHKGGTNALFNLKPIHQRVAPHCHRQKTSSEAAQAKKDLYTAKRRGRGGLQPF